MLRRSGAAVTAFDLQTPKGGVAQTAQPPMPDPQLRPTAAPENSVTLDAGSSILEATRKRFEANAAKQTESHLKRDAKLNNSMRSICAGCDAQSTKRARP